MGDYKYYFAGKFQIMLVPLVECGKSIIVQDDGESPLLWKKKNFKSRLNDPDDYATSFLPWILMMTTLPLQ
jgi:hypothetical protein